MKVDFKAFSHLSAMIGVLMLVGCAGTMEGQLRQKAAHRETPVPLSTTVDSKAKGLSKERGARETVTDELEMNSIMAAEAKRDRPSLDWGPRYVELLEFCAERFTEPEIGSKVSLSLENGTEVSGVLTKLTKRRVDLTIESGGSVRLAPDQLSTSSRCLLFKNEFVEHFATKRLEEEKSIYEATGRLPQ